MWDHFEFTVCQHFLPALINDDHSGLTTEDVIKLNDFLEECDNLLKKRGAKHWHWSVLVEDCSRFARCEISGLFGAVSDMGLMFYAEEVK